MANGLLFDGNRIFGFLAGTTLAGAAAYSFMKQEFKTSNDLLLEDLYVRVAI